MSLSKQRNTVITSFAAAEAINDEQFDKGNPNATEFYVYPNQIDDAETVVKFFHEHPTCRIVSVRKPTKVGANGFMIMIAKLFTTHSDDDFLIHYENVFFITGMSNKDWDEQLK